MEHREDLHTEATAEEMQEKIVLTGMEKPATETVSEELPDTDKNSAEKETEKPTKIILSYLHDIVYLLAILIVVSLMVVRVVVVSGTSMNHTLLDGDYLLVLSNAFYQQPKAGDIVVVSKESFDDGSPIVKRVIATSGQTVDIDFEMGIVYVDGVALDEPYTNTDTNHPEGMTFPLTVGEGYLFCLGDNRNVSKDSRDPEIGQIAVEEVLGKVVFLFFPGTNGTDIFGNPLESRDFSRIGFVN